MNPALGPPCSLHDGKNRPERGLYIEIGGIEQGRIRRGLQGRDGAAESRASRRLISASTAS